MLDERSPTAVIRDITIALGVVCLCAILIAHIATRPRYTIVPIAQLHQTDMVNAVKTDNTVAVIFDTQTGDVAPVCIIPSVNPLWTAWWTRPEPSMVPPPKEAN